MAALQAPAPAAGPDPGGNAAEESSYLRAQASRAASRAEPRVRIGTRSARLADLPARARPAPSAVAVPALGLEIPVVPVGVEGEERSLELPRDARRAGWYRHGPAPGEPGTAVLAAHVDWAGAPAAFFELRKLRPGDRVVVRGPGGPRRFEVVAKRRHAKDELPPRLWATDGPPALALVTCAGAFDPETRSYADNLVVWAVPA